MFEYIVIIGMLLVSGYWIVSPLLKSDPSESDFSPEIDNTLRDLNLKKEGAYATIKELEFDLNMGKLSREDFETLKRQYTLDAIGYLEEIDRLSSDKEKETESIKEDLGKETKRENYSFGEEYSENSATLFCTQCGTRASERDRFCSNCGAELSWLKN